MFFKRKKYTVPVDSEAYETITERGVVRRLYVGHKHVILPYGEGDAGEMYSCPECDTPVYLRHGSTTTCGNHNLVIYGNEIQVWDKDKWPFPLTPEERSYREWESRVIDSLAAAGDFGGIASFQIAQKQKRGG